MKIEYGKPQWRKGYPGKIDAGVAHNEIEKIRKAHDGCVTPEDVVEKASATRNKLHPAFVWDDKAAAYEHRLAEARRMLGALHVVRKEAPKYPSRTYEIQRGPAVADEEPRMVYKTVEDILADPQARAEMLQRALGELLSCRRKYQQLQELSIVFRAVDEVLEHHQA